jgi:hypothetical protein
MADTTTNGGENNSAIVSVSNNKRKKMDAELKIAQLVVTALGFIFVVLQFQKNTQEVSKTHDWNRRKASQEACYQFMDPTVQTHWSSIYDDVIIKGKHYAQLTDIQKIDVLKMIYFFEYIGISMKNNILEEDIIYDHFGSIWPLCYRATKDFVEENQKVRDDDDVFEHFVSYANKFQKRYDDTQEMTKFITRIPGKSKITG